MTTSTWLPHSNSAVVHNDVINALHHVQTAYLRLLQTRISAALTPSTKPYARHRLVMEEEVHNIRYQRRLEALSSVLAQHVSARRLGFASHADGTGYEPYELPSGEHALCRVNRDGSQKVVFARGSQLGLSPPAVSVSPATEADWSRLMADFAHMQVLDSR